MKYTKRFVWRTSPEIFNDLQEIADAKFMSINNRINAVIQADIIIYKRINKKKGDC